MVDLVDHRSIMTIPIGRENIRENHPRGRIHENLCCNVLHLPGSSRSVPHARIIRFFCHGQLTSTEPGDHFECTIWRFRSSQSRQNATSSKRKTIQQWCDSARVPLWCCTCWCPIKKSWSQLSSSSNNLSHRQDHYKHRGCWQNLVPKASAGKTHLISQRFLASQLGIVGQSIGRPVGILRIKSMIQVILTALAPRLSGFTVSPCSGISALREAWLLVGTVERNKQKKLDPSSLMWPLKQPILDIQCGWLALSHVKSLTTCCHLLPSIDWLLLIESCPAPPARAGGRAISWQVEKKTHGMNQWWTDPKWQNHGIYWWSSLWESMTLFCTSSVKISYMICKCHGLCHRQIIRLLPVLGPRIAWSKHTATWILGLWWHVLMLNHSPYGHRMP